MDDATYIALTRQLMPAMFRMAYSLLHNRPDAEDALQQSLLNAWKHRQKPRSGKEKSWLMRIVINESYAILRKHKRIVFMEDLSFLPAAIEPYSDTGLYDAIASLPETLRTPVLLKYMEGLTEIEGAAALGISVAAFKNRLFRARKRLQKQLNEEVGL